jgi:hypothetical protein
MVTIAKSAQTWPAVLALGVLAVAMLAVGRRAVEPLGGGATAAMARLSSHPEANATFDVGEAAAPASLHARLIELEARSEELAAKLARARRELSDL